MALPIHQHLFAEAATRAAGRGISIARLAGSAFTVLPATVPG